MARYRQIFMKFLVFPIKTEIEQLKKIKKLKKNKKVEKARVPESSNAHPIPGQHQGPAASDQRTPTPDNAIWPQTKPYSSKYQ